MFFINLGKKFSRAVGYAFCVIFLVLCVILIITCAAFGSRGAVEVFGFNIYIAETDEFDAVPYGSAVFAQRCKAYDLEEGNLVLYMRGGDDPQPALGYLDSIKMSDGVYTITVSDRENSYSFEETALIGKADLCSSVLGAIIRFSLTPLGIFIIALLPCLALILFDVIKAAVAKLPPPEVVPQLKNAPEEQPDTSSSISVNSDGKAAYSRSQQSKTAADADSVLFTYTGRQRSTNAKPEIIPLVKPTAPAPNKPSAAAKPAPQSNAAKIDPQPEKTEAKLEQRKSASETKTSDDLVAAGTPVSVAARRYLDNAVQPTSKSSEATAELPTLPKKSKNDAFFAQSEAPQIGRKSLSGERSTSRSVIDLEDAIAAGERTRENRSTKEHSGRRSAEILSQKNRDELMSDDDDDSLDKSRYEVDDILAGLERRRKQ